MHQKLVPLKYPTCRRPKNLDVRSREYLLEDEIDALIASAKKNNNGLRDSTLILLMFRHGLRLNEATNLRWSDIDFPRTSIHINRLKDGLSGRHPLKRIELVSLGKMYRNKVHSTPFVFLSRQGTPLSDTSVQRIVKNAGKDIGLDFQVHPHMFRHSCGYWLASQGVDTRAIAEYLGHKSLNNTYKYTAIAPNRFDNFFKD